MVLREYLIIFRGENSEKIGHLEDYQVIHKVEVNDRFTKEKQSKENTEYLHKANIIDEINYGSDPQLCDARGCPLNACL